MKKFMFDYIHTVLFIFGQVTAYWSFIKIHSLLDPQFSSSYTHKYPINRLLGLATTSLLWIFYGIHKNVNGDLLLLEGFTFCLLLMVFVVKINNPEEAILFGHKLPGHGKSETKTQIRLKYFLLFLLVITPVIIFILSLLNL